MISRIKGTVWEARPLELIVNIGGVGYRVNTTLAARLPDIGSPVDLYTYASYREDSAELYGFATAQERDLFATLIAKVSGIGPKTGMALLSHLPAARFQAAIEAGDIATLTATPGIGKKTAERLILELKGQLKSGIANAAGNISAGPQADAIAALMSLGYSQGDAQKAVAKAASAHPQAPASELIRLSLKK